MKIDFIQKALRWLKCTKIQSCVQMFCLNTLYNFVFQVMEKVVDYTHCYDKYDSGTTCASKLESLGTNVSGYVCYCEETFRLDEDFPVCISYLFHNQQTTNSMYNDMYTHL